MLNFISKHNIGVNFKSKKLILSFAWISLVFGLISFPDVFIGYVWDTGLTFSFPGILYLLFSLIHITPAIILIIYLTKYYSKNKNHLLFAITIGTIALEFFINTIICIITMCRVDSFGGMELPIDTIMCIVVVVMLIFATLNVLYGKKNNIFFIVATFLISTDDIVFLINELSSCIIPSIKFEGYYILTFLQITGTVSNLAIFVSILLFLLKNRIPPLIHISSEKIKAQEAKYTPAQSLRNLKDKLDMGLITEKEYQEARADIISKL